MNFFEGLLVFVGIPVVVVSLGEEGALFLAEEGAVLARPLG